MENLTYQVKLPYAIPRAPIHYGGAESLREAPKSPNTITSTFFNTVNLLPKELRFEHGGTKLVFCPGRHLTSSRPCAQGPCFSRDAVGPLFESFALSFCFVL